MVRGCTEYYIIIIFSCVSMYGHIIIICEYCIVLTYIVYTTRCYIHDVQTPCDIWHVSASLWLSYNIINACVLGDRLLKGIVFDNNRKSSRQPRPTVSSRRWRLCLDHVYIYIYLYYANNRTDVYRAPLVPLNGDKTNQKRTIATYTYVYSCCATAFVRLTYTRHFRIIIIRTASTTVT